MGAFRLPRSFEMKPVGKFEDTVRLREDPNGWSHWCVYIYIYMHIGPQDTQLDPMSNTFQRVTAPADIEYTYSPHSSARVADFGLPASLRVSSSLIKCVSS